MDRPEVNDPQPHPIYAGFMDYAQRMFADVEAQRIEAHVVMAILTAEALAVSVEDTTPPDVADALLDAATTWATRRRQALLAEVTARAVEIPNDIGGLDS